ncbi:MAG: D-alanyl-D-alanine dipeptidase [Sphingobacteriaceae bacterium]|nr:MAG: D-alanyl-D-alanine dipeptidase [Sphingobacteriaceae bacterium]
MKFGFAIALLFLQITVFAQPYKYIDSSKISATEKYRQQIKFQPEKALVDIEAAIPGIVLDIRYATTNNFTNQQVYKQAKAFARQPVVQALNKVQAELKNKGLGLKIYDAYRPYAITVKFYEIAKDTTFVADPRKGSRHNRGCAIDLTLIDLKTGKELDMPTAYDSFSKEAAAGYTNLSSQKLANRKLLRTVMEQHGFKIYPSEWWHYDFIGWEQFSLLDVPFEAL